MSDDKASGPGSDVGSFNSVHSTARISLRTQHSGRHSYEILDVGDAAYPSPKSRSQQHVVSSHGHNIVRGRFLEQNVMRRPSAMFKSSARIAHCLNDPLVPNKSYSDPHEGVIVLEGAPPFTLHLKIRSFATNDVKEEAITVHSREWKRKS